jgi:two-component sensor histidine kinase
VGGGKEVTAELEPVSLPGARATALALIFAELLQNALEHGGHRVRVELARTDDGNVLLAIADDGAGVPEDASSGTGLSIVRALVRDELRGTLDLRADGGTRAEVTFPA